MNNYDDSFFEYVNSGSTVSARQLLPAMSSVFTINSVLDVGCGQGAWLSAWRELGVVDVIGIDGDYVDRDRLLIPVRNFFAADLNMKFNLDRKFDLIQSLEVAEHLPEKVAPSFVESLCSHGDMVMFSAAPPGQGGDHHINEKPYEFWRELFERQGFHAYDYIRPLILSNSLIEPWYRFNTILYISENAALTVPDDVANSRLRIGAKIDDLSPLAYQMRKRFVRNLPVPVMTKLAKLKERVVARSRSGGHRR